MSFNRALLALTLALVLAAMASMAQNTATAKILVYSATAGYRHASIPGAITALKARGPSQNMQFDSTEDAGAFTDQSLAQYDAVLFLMTTGAVLNDTGVTALQNYLNLGGNFVAVHSASDSLTNITFFGRELGAYFDYHPALQNATVVVLDPTHPSTSMLPARWPVQDEIYNFKSDPRSVGAVVVLTVDESTYVDDGTRKFDQGTPHPIAWYQERGAGVTDPDAALVGRSFYTSLGHESATWQNETFVDHVMGGITWTLNSETTRAFNATANVGNPAQNDTTTAPGQTSSGASAPESPPPNGARKGTSVMSTILTTLVAFFGILAI